MPEHDIPLSRPDLSALEQRLVLDVLRSGRLSIGPVLEEFESLVAERAGCAHGVGTSSGTAGLHLVLKALGVGPGDEVITTPFSFVASSNVVEYVGAKPIFVDIEPSSLNMDPARVEGAITDKTAAILAVEAFGNPKHMDRYAQIAARHEIPLIEDSCEALGCTHKGRRAGGFGRAGVFGFYPNKQITTGEGGMIVTDDQRLADGCRSLRNHGRPVGSMGADQGSWLNHVQLGYNYRLSEISAAIGVAQMRRFDEMVEHRQNVAGWYLDRLMGVSDLIVPTVDPDTFMTWFVFVVRLETDYTRDERDRIIRGMRMHDIGVADYFPCIHLQPHYRKKYGYTEGDFKIAESVSGRTIALPFHGRMTEHEVDVVVQTLSLLIQRQGLSRS
jgi:perosamine synthetase